MKNWTSAFSRLNNSIQFRYKNFVIACIPYDSIEKLQEELDRNDLQKNLSKYIYFGSKFDHFWRCSEDTNIREYTTDQLTTKAVRIGLKNDQKQGLLFSKNQYFLVRENPEKWDFLLIWERYGKSTWFWNIVPQLAMSKKASIALKI